MRNSKRTFFTIVLFTVICSIACSNGDAQKNTTGATPTAKPAATPGKNFTPADIAKLKWIEGTWRGMDGDKPFYERYKLEGDAMIVESLLENGNIDGAPERFELKNGEFGKGEGDKRSAASEITDTYVQFVPAVPGKGNNFRFLKQPHGWDAILEWEASGDKPARQKTYKMEPWKPAKAAM